MFGTRPHPIIPPGAFTGTGWGDSATASTSWNAEGGRSYPSSVHADFSRNLRRALTPEEESLISGMNTDDWERAKFRIDDGVFMGFCFQDSKGRYWKPADRERAAALDFAERVYLGLLR